MKLPRIAYLSIAGFFLYAAITVSRGGQAQTESICQTALNLDHISCGEEIIIIPPSGGKNRREKQAGFMAIKQQDYGQAIEFLQKDWEQVKDPETLIALNNVKVFQNPKAKSKTIAVVVPSRETPSYVSENILKGVSEAQREWNQADHTWKLQVIIADDSNDPAEGKKIATELVKHPDIFAVLGHYSSTVTVAVKDIYNQAQKLLLSATSTADELTSQDINNYFFRVTNTTTTSSHHLAQKWATKSDKIALFHTPDRKFSEAFRKAFIAKIPAENIVKEFYLSNRNNAAQELAVAKAAGAKNIVIIPDAYTDENERDRVLSIIKANQGQLPILGASIVRDAYLFQVDPQYLKNLTIAIPVHPSDQQFIDASRLSQSPNWWGTKTQIHDRIINSYDATQVLLAALDKSDNPGAIRQTITDPNFSTRGITGKISFQGSNRAEKISSLVTPTNCNDAKCNFKLVN
jgi:eukaryotic-like serine/threonine-protein kinase